MKNVVVIAIVAMVCSTIVCIAREYWYTGRYQMCMQYRTIKSPPRTEEQMVGKYTHSYEVVDARIEPGDPEICARYTP